MEPNSKVSEPDALPTFGGAPQKEQPELKEDTSMATNPSNICDIMLIDEICNLIRMSC